MHKRDSTAEYTLLHHSACKIISHILVKCNGCYQNMPPYNHAEHRVKGIDQLDLPQDLKDLLHSYVGPIHEELRCWHNHVQRFINPTEEGPVFTWRGTLDMAGTAKKVVFDNKTQNLLGQYIVACMYGFERDIHELERLLTRENIRVLQLNLYDGFIVAKLWLAHTDKSLTCGQQKKCLINLDEKLLHEITEIALENNNDVVFKYLKVTPIEKARKLINTHFVKLLDKQFRVFPPKSYHRLFKYLSKIQRKEHLSLYSYNILMALLKWPFQGRFIEVSQSLVANLDGLQYKRVWNEILCNIDTKSYDYVPLLHSFYKSGVDRKHPFFRNPNPVDQRLINLVRSVLVRHRYPDIIDEVKDDTIVSTLQILDIS